MMPFFTMLRNNTDKTLEKEIDELKRMIGKQAMVINLFKKI